MYLAMTTAGKQKKAIREFLRKGGLWRKTRSIRRKIRKSSFPRSGEELLDSIPYRRAENILAAAEEFIEIQSSYWFLWVHLMDTHIPYMPVNYGSFTTYNKMMELNDKILAVKYSDYQIKEEERHEIKRLYAEEVRYMDKHLAKFLEKQDKATLVVITSDHGEMFGEYGLYSHTPGRRNHGLTPQLLHVPLIFHGAGIKSQTINDYVCHLDVAPTILDIAGINVKLGYGRSLKNLLTG